jgi:hypothetical protein
VVVGAAVGEVVGGESGGLGMRETTTPEYRPRRQPREDILDEVVGTWEESAHVCLIIVKHVRVQLLCH